MPFSGPQSVCYRRVHETARPANKKIAMTFAVKALPAKSVSNRSDSLASVNLLKSRLCKPCKAKCVKALAR